MDAYSGAFQASARSETSFRFIACTWLEHWEETHHANRLLDPSSTTLWRHARQGETTHWEQPLVNAHGLTWWRVAECEPDLWKAHRQSFLEKTLSTFGLGTPTLPSTGGCEGVVCIKVLVSIPIWQPEPLDPQSVGAQNVDPQSIAPQSVDPWVHDQIKLWSPEPPEPESVDRIVSTPRSVAPQCVDRQ